MYFPFSELRKWSKKMEEYCMYFPFSELRKWSKKTAETRRRNCAVLPLI